MAYERASDSKVKGDSLDAFVENLTKAFSRQVAVRNADDELKFNTAVLENNLSLGDQLAYRQDQYKRVSDDPEERKRIRGEVASLKQRIEQKKYADEYMGQLTDVSSGMSSIDSVITFLNDYKSKTTNQTILDNINQQLQLKADEKFKLTKQLISNQSDYAIKDKSTQVIDTQIAKVTSAKAKALLAGDETTASAYDLQLQGLNKAKVETGIERDIKNFAAATVTGFASATKLLDSYNEKVANAADNTPITIGDVTYSSAREFWTYKRDSYVADQSASGLFSRISSEVEGNIKVAASKNSLTTKNLADFTSPVNSLLGRPELAGYQDKINMTKQSALQTGAGYITDTIENKYSLDYDINKAMGELNTLKTLGVNVDSSIVKVTTAAANIKSNQVNSISTLASQLMNDNPGWTPEQAVQEAVKMGQGTTLSPDELAKKSAGDISTSALSDPSNANDPKFTETPPPTPAAPGSAPANNTPSYNGVSLVDYLNSRNLASDYTSRAKLAAEKGITNYTGTAAQNTQLLGLLNTAQPTPTPTPSPTPLNPNPAPAPTPAPTPAPPKTTYGGNSINDYLVSLGQDSSFTARSKMAKEKGILNYQGTADQNTQLLKNLRGF